MVVGGEVAVHDFFFFKSTFERTLDRLLTPNVDSYEFTIHTLFVAVFLDMLLSSPEEGKKCSPQ